MSSEIPNDGTSAESTPTDPARPETFDVDAPPATSVIEQLRPVLGPLSSLKVAVSMFACSLFLVMIGTLAQVDADIWDVVAQYFRCWVAWVPLRTLHPLFARIESIEPIRDFFHGLSPSVGIWFPGGFLIGAVMTVNLVSAFIMKFHIQARGNRLYAGAAVSLIGLFGIGIAVVSGDSQTGLQEAGIEWDTLWRCLQGLTVALLAVNLWGIYETANKKMAECFPLVVSAFLLSVAGYWLFTLEERFDDSSMRILWQLIKGEAPALVLLAGFIMLFKKRGGVVLIHAGIALMMFNEVLVHVEHIETQMSIEEGETVNFAEDVRSIELAFVDTTSDPNNNHEILVPRDFFDSTNATYVAQLAEELSRSSAEATDLSGKSHRQSGTVPQGTLAEFEAAHATLQDIPVEDEFEAAHQAAVAALATAVGKREAVEEVASRRTEVLAPVMKLIKAAEVEPGDDDATDAEKAAARVTKVAKIRADHKAEFDHAAKIAAEMHALLPDLAKTLTAAETAILKLDEPLRAVISNPKLPFDLRIDRFMQNSDPRDLRPGEENLATAGSGVKLKAAPVRAGVGTDTGGAIDFTSAYVTLVDRTSKKELGTYLLGVYFQLINDPNIPPNVIEHDGKTWDLALRFERHYKPYSVYLSDVSKKDYIGTSTPRDYRSVVTISEEDGTSFERDIWMNNPLRYAGETFYQSNYTAANPRTGEAEKTTLQVVRNTGWMIPYVSCMIVGTGLLAHFWSVLIRFLSRRSSAQTLKTGLIASLGALFGFAALPLATREKDDEDNSGKSSDLASKFKPAKRDDDLVKLEPDPKESGISIAVSLILALCVAGWLYGKAVPKNVADGGADLKAFGELPLVYEGRTKPFDTLARNSLRVLSNRTTFVTQVEVKDKDGKVVKDDDGNPRMKDVKNPAILWLLDVMSDPEAAGDHKVFRIENPQVQKTLGLERRKGFMYSLKEFYEKLPDLAKEAQVARDKDDGKRSADERKLLELESKLGVLDILMNSFSPPNVPELPRGQDPMALQQYFMNLQRVKQSLDRFDGRQPPLSVPPVPGEESDEEEAILATDEWQTFSRGWFNSYLQVNIQGQDPSEPVKLFTEILVAHSHGEPADFNEKVAEYRRWLDRNGPEDLNLKNASFETYFNEFAPAYYSAFSYLAAFIFAGIALLGWSKPLNRAALLTIILTFFVHSFALLARMEISGRPPVTNLYSSAVFIGWGGVLIGIVFEALYKNGIGNVIGSTVGAVTLGIAYLLSGDGDTFKVLQAVLDTQFWLATHVVCITLGYSTTLIAGTLGQYYVLSGFSSRKVTPAISKDLSRMIYGTVCFGIFFSFVGTVLGGLWADDSWGRFWGWDPKENGALLIVIWNVLLLHARWDGMVKDRGFAVLAVGGNIITSWSWFGVNELGVGLHSYGFTSGVWSTLWLFWLSQFVVCGIGMLPRRYWTSFRAWDRPGDDKSKATA